MTESEAAADFQIEGNDIDAQEIEREIRARSRVRQAEAQAKGLDHEAYASGLQPLPADAVFSRELYEAVGQVGFGADKVGAKMDLTETQVPVVGGLVQRFRAGIHEVVLFYLNHFESQQMRFNEQTARALGMLIRDLEAEVRDIRARLAELEDSQA